MKKYRRGKNRCKYCGWELDNGNSHRHLYERFVLWLMSKLPKEKTVELTKEIKPLPLFPEENNVQ